ncbi:MAG: SLC13 family permease [Planctomycetes bacterium]|nr:SLC13 family permease [Planctomycetota bacterium]
MDRPDEHGNQRYGARSLSLVLGPVCSIVLLCFFNLDPENPFVTRTAAVALLMAIWWMTEALPLAITALLPIVLFPVLGIMDGKSVAPIYSNHIIFLFIGGFIVALAMQRWDLHKRIALKILLFFGTRPRNLLLGFMTAAAFLSMWISNTATTMMMVPIVLAVILKFEDLHGCGKARKIAVGLMLGVAYGATLGGIATLVGTPPNQAFIQIFEISFPGAPEINFADWMFFALPTSMVMMLFVWMLLTLLFMRNAPAALDRHTLRSQYEAMGPMTFEQKVVLVDFVLLALLWVLRADLNLGFATIPGWERLFERPSYLNDGTVAITLALILFLIPARRQRGFRIMDWETATRLPWNIVLLFGGGFALASGFKESGLSLWIGNQLSNAHDLHPLCIIALISLLVTFLTELTSNTATAQMLLPILAGLALTIRINPLLLMVPGTLACSMAFMLPVATPPNAIIFGTGRLRITDMARTGFILNLVGVFVVTLATWLIGRAVFDIDLSIFPDWAGK